MSKRASKPDTQQFRTEFRQRLAAARRALARTVAMTETEMQAVVGPESHGFSDDAASNVVTSILGRLDGRGRHELDEIEAAQARLEAGTFGACERCHRAIPLARLRAIPTARTCATCQRQMEVAEQAVVGTAPWRCSVALAILLTLGLISSSEAAPGDLDPTFGEGGKVITPFQVQSLAKALVLQADGKVVAAGGAFQFALARYLPDGSLDATFGTGGTVTTSFNPLFFATANALVVQPDGKLVAAGHVGTSNATLDFALARYLPDGRLDSTFGTSGTVTTDLSGDEDAIGALVLQPDGKLVAAGWAGGRGALGRGALARYLPDGNLDPTFGAGGSAIIDNFQATALVLQRDGKLIMAGRTAVSQFGLARFQRNGTLDSSFGTGGRIATEVPEGGGASALIVQTDGKLVAAGGLGAFDLVRYLSDGSVDATFGVNGKVATEFGGQDMGLALVLQPDGKLVMAGGSNSSGNFEFALVRYLSTGDLDPTFGIGGRVTTSFGIGQIGEDIAEALVLQTDGKLVAAGGSRHVSPDIVGFSLARYESGLAPGVGPPTNKDECKHNGWRTLTIPRTFKNQGDCIQFVNTGK